MTWPRCPARNSVPATIVSPLDVSTTFTARNLSVGFPQRQQTQGRSRAPGVMQASTDSLRPTMGCRRGRTQNQLRFSGIIVLIHHHCSGPTLNPPIALSIRISSIDSPASYSQTPKTFGAAGSVLPSPCLGCLRGFFANQLFRGNPFYGKTQLPFRPRWRVFDDDDS
jgi:hypothetical protein